MLALMPASGVAGSAGILSPSECSQPVVVDYAAPLKAMPRVRQVTMSGRRLHFAPAAFELYALTGSVLPGSSTVGFYLHAPADAPRGWAARVKTRSRLLAVNRAGVSGRVLDTTKRTLRRPLGQAPGTVWLGRFPVAGKPRFYRLDVTFTSPAWARPQTYSQYLRVVPVRTKARIAVSIARPGSRLYWRVENIGTTGLLYGLFSIAERREGSAWVRTDLLPSSAPSIGIILPGGYAGDCESVQLPEVLEPGSYRIHKDVGRESAIFGRFEIQSVP